MRAPIAAISAGAVSAAVLLVVYFSVLSLLSGWDFAFSQFAQYWAYVVALALGFGTQVSLYAHLKRLSMAHHHMHHMVTASGTTSTAAMLACCTHYLANILPLLGAAGVVSLVAQYQLELFWLALLLNLAGIVFIGRQLWSAKRAYAGTQAC